ncbi:unnamed protein product [Peronospora belbahrii]|nr:unnamed protein product [Peronospora belbahrii]
MTLLWIVGAILCSCNLGSVQAEAVSTRLLHDGVSQNDVASAKAPVIDFHEQLTDASVEGAATTATNTSESAATAVSDTFPDTATSSTHTTASDEVNGNEDGSFALQETKVDGHESDSSAHTEGNGHESDHSAHTEDSGHESGSSHDSHGGEESAQEGGMSAMMFFGPACAGVLAIVLIGAVIAFKSRMS